MKTLFTTLALLVIVLTSSAQSTLLKLKFEEAEQAYNEGRYEQTLSNLSELESEGLESPRILHLKILTKGKIIQGNLTESGVSELKNLIDLYFEKYDIEGLEDKYKEVYEVYKTLEALQTPSIKAEGDKYFNIDNKVALKYYLEAYNAGLQDASMWGKISNIYQYFIDTNTGNEIENKMEAAKWLQMAAEAGDPNSCVKLGYQYKNGLGIRKDIEMAVKLFKIAAEKGHPEAQYEMGMAYFNGDYFSVDYTESMKWYTLAADNQTFHEKANYEVGVAYASKNNFGKAYLSKVIDQKSIDYAGDYYKARAMIFYVKYYGSSYNGIDLVPEILKIFQEGATTYNSPLAKFYLGLLYDNAFKECKIKKDSKMAQGYFTDAEKNMNNKNELGQIQFNIFMDLRAYESSADRTIYLMNAMNNGNSEAKQYLKFAAKNGDKSAQAILKIFGIT
jgi:TPR repeat protein